jgi:hypothetical protein
LQIFSGSLFVPAWLTWFNPTAGLLWANVLRAAWPFAFGSHEKIVRMTVTGLQPGFFHPEFRKLTPPSAMRVGALLRQKL